jgi:hypothetical protein
MERGAVRPHSGQTRTSDVPIGSQGTLGAAMNRGDRATAGYQHICVFRFLSFVCSISLFKGTQNAAH